MQGEHISIQISNFQANELVGVGLSTSTTVRLTQGASAAASDKRAPETRGLSNVRVVESSIRGTPWQTSSSSNGPPGGKFNRVRGLNDSSSNGPPGGKFNGVRGLNDSSSEVLRIQLRVQWSMYPTKPASTWREKGPPRAQRQHRTQNPSAL